ncbi:MAG TPA: MATE family efflux transporter [Symbiobacteriaceae bacterium]|jgi:putative MATE family efflux protein|nr:MATE family efflux transporter [Symbiobacteriaceae bacterium]
MSASPAADLGPLAENRWAIRKQILTLAVPVVMEQILTTLTQMVDTMMVSHLGPEASAAVGLSNQPLFFSMAIFMGIGTGTTALVARYTGAKDPDTVEAVTRQSFWMGLFSAIVVAYAYFALAPQIIHYMGAEPGVAPLGTAFLRWSTIGYIAMQWSQVMGGAVRGRGDTVTPLYIGVVVNIVNVILGYGLIWGKFGLPALGVVGSALGTTIARCVGAVVLLVVLIRSDHPVRLRLATLFRFDFGMMGRVLKIGLPASGERALQSLGMISFTRIISSLGTISIAAHVITNNAESISYMPAIGLGTAATALVGQRLGAKDQHGAGLVISETVRIVAIVAAVMSLVFFFLGGPYISMYTGDPAVHDLSVNMLRIAAIAQIPMGITFVLSGALRGAGDTLPMMVVTAIGVWVVRLTITGGLISWAGWGLAAAWTSMFFDWSFRGIFAYLRFRFGNWKQKRI